MQDRDIQLARGVDTAMRNFNHINGIRCGCHGGPEDTGTAILRASEDTNTTARHFRILAAEAMSLALLERARNEHAEHRCADLVQSLNQLADLLHGKQKEVVS